MCIFSTHVLISESFLIKELAIKYSWNLYAREIEKEYTYTYIYKLLFVFAIITSYLDCIS